MHGLPRMTNSTGRLTEVREKYGRSPGIIPIMRDDRAFDEVGTYHVHRKMRDLEMPGINRPASEGV